MRIAVIGSGNVGGTLGRRWATLGHDVVFGVRDPKRGAAAVKGGAGEGALPDRARVATPAQAVRGDDGWRADVVLVATPWPAVASALSELGPGALDGVVLLDATNPLGPGLRLESGPDGASGAEQVQALAPTARVVKAFNTTGAENMADAAYPGGVPMMPVCGDDAQARQRVMALATLIGFEAVDMGPLMAARYLEPFAMTWIHLAFRQGFGRRFAFGLLRRD